MRVRGNIRSTVSDEKPGLSESTRAVAISLPQSRDPGFRPAAAPERPDPWSLLALFVHGQSQQVCVAHLQVTHQSFPKRLHGLNKADLIGPESVRRMLQISSE